MIYPKRVVDLARLAMREDASPEERHAAAMGIARIVFSEEDDPTRPKVVPLPPNAVRAYARGFQAPIRPLSKEELDAAANGVWVDVNLKKK